MSEADILALTYEDRCSVYRPFKEVLQTGESVFKKGIEGKKVYEEILCALSGQSGGKVYQSPSTAKAATEYCLFTRPEIEIEPNDYMIITHLDKDMIAMAGKPERMSSHNNVPLKLEKETV